MDLGELTRALTKFRDERGWAQFHTLRNLIVSLNLEAAELLELTQWKSDPEIAALPEDGERM
jgi:NTP pyrophosphatase (non-canonical NTP hydrolase)